MDEVGQDGTGNAASAGTPLPELPADDTTLALERLLAGPTLGIAGVGSDGLFMPLPEELASSGHRVLEARSALDLIEPSDRPVVIDAWRRTRETGRGIAHVRLVNGGGATFHSFDATAKYGMFVLVALPMPGSMELPAVLDPVQQRPRLFTMLRDELGVPISVDPAAEELVGWRSGELLGRSSLELIHPDDQTRGIDNWIAALASPGVPHRWRGRYLRSDGSWIWLEITNTSRLNERGGAVFSELVDVSDEMAAHEAVQQREELLRRVAEALPLGLMWVDVDRRILYANEQLEAITGTGEADDPLDRLAHVVDADVDAVGAAFDAALIHARDVNIEIHLDVPGAARTTVCTLTLRPLTGADDAVTGAIVCLADVTDTVLLRRELEWRATFDDLTGCFNRASIIARLDAAVGADRSEGLGTAVLFMDLDDYKQINDRLGHDAGDELLRVVAERLRHAVRPQDEVGRLGGDEFVVVCAGLADRGEAERVAQRVLDVVSEPVRLGEALVTTSVSVGVGFGHGSPSELVALADEDMYRCKREHQSRASGLVA